MADHVVDGRGLLAFPNPTRARLFFKDVESSKGMVIDDNREQRAESRNRVLDAPIGEFELSVRARNCLKKMKVQTLGGYLAPKADSNNEEHGRAR